MKTMNQNQQRYAMRRVEEIRKAREESLREKHTTIKKGLTISQKLREIRRGNVDTCYQSRQKINSKTLAIDVFYFGDAETNEVFDEKAFKRDRQKLRKEVAKVTDEIMLGDADKAKQLLEKFERTV